MKMVATENAPAAVGPYSQGMVSNGMLFCSGQVPLIPGTKELVTGDIKASTKRSLDNVLAVVEAGGGSLTSIVKVSIFVRDMGQFSTINEVYSSFFGEHRPARAVVEVSKLPLDAEIEIECIAEVSA